MLLLTASALARPMFEPDLSFQQTALVLPACTPDTTTTWEISQETTGRSYGEDIETGENLDRDIHVIRRNRLSITCLSNTPLTIAVTPGWKVEDRWHTADFALVFRVPSWSAPELVETRGDSASWQGTITALLPFIFPPMAATTPQPGATWDGAWPVDMGPWWNCHGAVTAGDRAGLRDYTFKGRCESISYQGDNRLRGTFTRPDGGFGVQEATWHLGSLWEHYMIFTDTDTEVTVTRVAAPRASPAPP